MFRPIAGMLLAMLATSIAAAASLPPGFEELKAGIEAPTTSFAGELSSPTTIADFKGKIAVLNLWATWCGPCVKEMPSLERLATRLPAKDFAVIAVSQDKGGVAVARSFLDRIGVHRIPLYVDPTGRLARELGVRGLPTTILIDREGVIFARLEGATEWDADSVVAYLLSASEKQRVR